MVELSIITLERILEKKRSRLNKLQQKHDKLQKALDIVNSKLDKIAGGKPQKTGKSQKRPKNKMSLWVTIQTILKGKQLVLADIVKGVKSAGYKSNSGNFKGVVYQAIHTHLKEVKKEDGIYSLRSVK